MLTFSITSLIDLSLIRVLKIEPMTLSFVSDCFLFSIFNTYYWPSSRESPSPEPIEIGWISVYVISVFLLSLAPAELRDYDF